MNGNLEKVLDFLESKTGVFVTVFTKDKNLLRGESNALFPENYTSGILPDKDSDKTYFSFSFEGEDYIGAIEGGDKTGENYAYFISETILKKGASDKKSENLDIIKKVLLGENKDEIKAFAEKNGIKDEKCFVILFSLPEDKVKGANEVLSAFTLGSKDKTTIFDKETVAYLKFIGEKDFKDYNSFESFATFLTRAVFEEIGALPKAFIGGEVKNISDASISLKQAISAREICIELGEKGNVHSYKEFLPYEMLSLIPKVELNKYLDFFLSDKGAKVISDGEISETVGEFFENNLNVSETARKLYLHRNTLMYRLDKIERATGLDLRKFNDAVIFKVITYLIKITK